MSHKTKKYGHACIENMASRKEQREEPAEQETLNQDAGMFSRIVEGAHDKVSRAANTASHHRTMIAVIGASSATAIFLMGTERGRSVSRRIGQLTTEGYDTLSEYAVDGWDRLKDVIQGATSTEDAPVKSELDEKIRQLQEKFKSPAA
jgi:hypothetical protein